MKLRGKADFPRPRRILIVQPRRIGDVILGTPAIRALAQHFPDAPIDFLAEPPAHEAVLGHPLITRLLVAPKNKLLRDNLAFIRELRRERYDWTIDFFSNPRSAQFALLSGARVRVGLDRRGRRWAYTHHIVEEDIDRDRYAADWRLEVLRLMGVPTGGWELEIYSDRAVPEAVARAEAALAQVDRSRPVIAFATGNGNTEKLYPPELTRETMEGLLVAGFELVVTSGPGERKLAEAALAGLSCAVPHLTDAHVPALAALYRRTQLYVGPDSGPKHVAVACGIPTVTIFGLGRPANWNDPRNPKNVVITPPNVPADCDLPAFERGAYMRKIKPEEIVRAAVDLLPVRGLSN